MRRCWMTWTLCAGSFLGLAAPAKALEVAITSPAAGATVSGTIAITGTSQGLVNGHVSVSIDGGPFQLATGTNPWSFAWDTTAVPDGSHTITARARECIGCPPVFHTISVVVNNQGALSVTITSPADGAVVLDSFTVTGVSSGATAVSLAVDQGLFSPVSGVNSWSYVFEPGSISPGPHTLTALAVNGAGQEASDSISITVGTPPPGSQTITYTSSVDGEPMTAVLWIPAGFNPSGPPVPLVCWLHGGGGTGVGMVTLDGGVIPQELDARGWIGIAPDGRHWGLAAMGCEWQTSAAYVNNPDPNVGPGEQDILDAIDWTVANYPIDTDRIYLTGHSMGGRGTYIIGLKNPDRFAAVAPTGPAIDMYEIFVRRPEPNCICKQGMVGGDPEESPFVDTMYTITSGRFLIENAFNLPVYHGHGLNDTIANNTVTNAPFLHGWHITSDTSWNACFITPDVYNNPCLHDPSQLPYGLCFGHTPTLSELRARHPEGYDWARMFTPGGHSPNRSWFEGTPVDPSIVGVVDPLNPGQYLGIMEFFARHTLVHNPATVVYKTYTGTHRRAYWAEIDITTPWLDAPGAVRASRDAAANALDVELVRVAVATFDLDGAGLDVAPGATLSIGLAPLVEPVYDPALLAPGEELAPLIVLDADFSAASGVQVLRDGMPLDEALVSLTGTALSIGPLAVDAPTALTVTVLAAVPGDLDGDGTVGILDFLGLLGAWGPCPQPCPPACLGDLDDDCNVGILDLLILLGNWG